MTRHESKMITAAYAFVGFLVLFVLVALGHIWRGFL